MDDKRNSESVPSLLQKAAGAVCSFLEEVLPSLSVRWWDLNVLPHLSFQQRRSVDASLLSHLRVFNGFPTAADLVENDVGGGLPYEGLGLVVPGGEPLVDGLLQFRNAAEGAAPNHAVGDQAEPAFDLIEPRTAGRCEMKVEPASFLWL